MTIEDIRRFQANLRDERDGAALYTAIAAAEADPVRKDLFLQLAQAESEHAELWRKKLAAAEFSDRDKYATQADARSISAEERLTNARELARTQIAKESEELEQTPQAERHELALIYQAKGLPKAQAERVAAELMRDRRAALDTLAREELGIDPTELGGSPVGAASTSFGLFAAGAIVPVVPFLILQGMPAIGASIGASALALAGVGVVTSLFNGRSPWFSAVRQVIFGCAAAGVTYGIGGLLGVSLS